MKPSLSNKYTISLRPNTWPAAYPYYGPHEIGESFSNIAGDEHIVISSAQATSFNTVVERQGASNLKAINLEFGPNPALMVIFSHITIGIEPDGYSHS